MLRIAPPIGFYITTCTLAFLNMSRNDAMATVPILGIITMIMLIFTGGYGSPDQC